MSDKSSARVRKWREQNHDRCLEQGKQWRAAHPNAHRDWRRNNREKMRAIAMRYRAKNRLAIKTAYVLQISVPEARELIGVQS